MPTTTLVKAPRTLIAAATSNAAGGTTRAALDLRTTAGGVLTIKLTNGGTGPTAQAVARVMIAHDSGATPATGAAGAVWKTIWEFGGGIENSRVTERAIVIDPAVMHVQVEIAGNTGQAVTCEAFLSELSSFSTT